MFITLCSPLGRAGQAALHTQPLPHTDRQKGPLQLPTHLLLLHHAHDVVIGHDLSHGGLQFARMDSMGGMRLHGIVQAARLLPAQACILPLQRTVQA